MGSCCGFVGIRRGHRAGLGSLPLPGARDQRWDWIWSGHPGELELCLSGAGSGPSSSRIVSQEDSIGKGTELPLVSHNTSPGCDGDRGHGASAFGMSSLRKSGNLPATPVLGWQPGLQVKSRAVPAHSRSGGDQKRQEPSQGAKAGTGDTGTSQELWCVGRWQDGAGRGRVTTRPKPNGVGAQDSPWTEQLSPHGVGAFAGPALSPTLQHPQFQI